MAVIRYTLTASGGPPSGISDGNHYLSRDGAIRIGIGTSGGTEITKSELLDYVKTRVSLQNDDDSQMNDSQKTTHVNAWCSARGIS